MTTLAETLAVMTRRPVPVPPTAAEIGAGVQRLVAAHAVVAALTRRLAQEQRIQKNVQSFIAAQATRRARRS